MPTKRYQPRGDFSTALKKLTKAPPPPKDKTPEAQRKPVFKPPLLYVPPGTNDIWVGSTPVMPGQELEQYYNMLTGGQYYNPSSNQAAGSTGGGTASPVEASPTPITWSEKYQLPGSPEFWKGMMPSQWTPETEFAAMACTYSVPVS